MPKYNHEHIYLRVTDLLIKCTIEGCRHTLSGPIELVEGRKAQCPYCNRIFTMTKEHLKRKKIHCLRCEGGEGRVLEAEPLKLTEPQILETEPPEEKLGEAVFADLLKARKIG